MRTKQPIPGDPYRRLKVLSAAVGVGAVFVMGTLTVALSASRAPGGSTTQVIADTITQSPPATTSTTLSVAPALKAPAFVGGDWPGMHK